METSLSCKECKLVVICSQEICKIAATGAHIDWTQQQSKLICICSYEESELASHTIAPVPLLTAVSLQVMCLQATLLLCRYIMH